MLHRPGDSGVFAGDDHQCFGVRSNQDYYMATPNRNVPFNLFSPSCKIVPRPSLSDLPMGYLFGAGLCPVLRRAIA